MSMAFSKIYKKCKNIFSTNHELVKIYETKGADKNKMQENKIYTAK